SGLIELAALPRAPAAQTHVLDHGFPGGAGSYPARRRLDIRPEAVAGRWAPNARWRSVDGDGWRPMAGSARREGPEIDLRDRLERRGDGPADEARARGGLSRHRYRQPAAPLPRGRRRRSAAGSAPRWHLRADQVHPPGRAG